MWMMGYNEGGDSFNSRKLRPLIPRPQLTTNTTHSLCSTHIHGTDLLALNHHLASVAEQSKRELNGTQHVVVSSRWNPTPEQLQILEDLYGGGTRTPSTDQIQHITTQLRRFGKIEGKNVFYWFQNHKARERQKRRRQLLESTTSDDLLLLPDQLLEDQLVDTRKESEANRTGFEVERQTKSWAPLTDSSVLAERCVSKQRAAKAGGGGGGPERRAADGWEQFEERGDLLLQQQRRGLAERNATWQEMMQLSSPTNLTNYTTATTTGITASITTTIPSSSTITTTLESKLMKGQGFNIFGAPACRDDYSELHDLLSFCDERRATTADEKSKTLQLFPPRSDDDNDLWVPKETQTSGGTMNNNSNKDNNDATPSQFFEFLPLKN